MLRFAHYVGSASWAGQTGEKKMNFNDDYLDKRHPTKYPKHPSVPFLSSDNTIAIFTTLSILLKMKNRLGLEAMMEYMEFYLATIERHNPRFKGAVEQAMALVSVEKMYGAMRKDGKKDKG